MAGPVGGSTRPAPKTSALDTLLAAARAFDAAVYQATAHQVRALGVGLDAATFERAAVLYAERSKGTAEAEGNTFEEIEERGYFDLVIDGRIRFRVIVDE